MQTNICNSTVASLCYMILHWWVLSVTHQCQWSSRVLVRMACIFTHLELFFNIKFTGFSNIILCFYNILNFYFFPFFSCILLLSLFSWFLHALNVICINLYYLDINSRTWVFMRIIWNTYKNSFQGPLWWLSGTQTRNLIFKKQVYRWFWCR